MSSERGEVRVALSTATVARLIGGGALYAAELRCLDCESKNCLRRLMLESCAQNMGAPDEKEALCAQRRSRRALHAVT